MKQNLKSPCQNELTTAEIRRGLRLNVVSGCLGMGWVAIALGMTLTLFLEKMGATGFQIGLLVTVQQLAMLVQIPASLIAERMPARKVFWGPVALVHRLLWFVPAVLPWILPDAPATSVWIVVGVVMFSSLLGQASVPVWFSWMADLVPQPLVNRFWGLRQSVVMGSFLVVTWGAAWLLDRLTEGADMVQTLRGFGIVFAIAGVMGIGDILVHLFVPEPCPHPVDDRESLWQRVREPFRNPDFLWLTLFVGVWFFSVGVFGSFGVVYLVRTFGASYTELSALAIAGSIGAIFAGLLLGPLMDRWGARRVGGMLLLAGPMLNMVWFLVSPAMIEVTLPLLGTRSIHQPILLIGATNLVTGALFSGVGLVQIKLLNTFSQSRGRTMAMAGHWTIVGMMGACGPLLGGKLMDLLSENPLPYTLPSGLPVSFFHVLVLIHISSALFVGLPMLRRIRRSKNELPIGASLARLTVGNPLRIVGRLYYTTRNPPSL